MDPKIYTVTNENVEMRYFAFGEGKRDMVILPGLSILSVMDSAALIAESYAMFAKEYRVWVFDWRENLPDEYSVEDMAEDTAGVMKVLGIENACIFGASQGGMMAQCIAINHPELVHKVILASTCADTTSFGEGNVIARWIRLAELKKIHELNISMSEMIYSPAVFMQFKDVIQQSEERITDEALKRFLILAKGIEGFNVQSRLKDIQCPVLVIGSYEDKVIESRLMKELAEESKAELYLYNEFSHAVYDEAPDFKERMLLFFHEETVEELVVKQEEEIAESDKGTRSVKKEGLKLPFILLGAVIYSVGINLFLRPLHLYSGGLMGFAQLSQTLFARAGITFGGFDISGVLYYIFNIPGLVLAATKMRKRFIFKTIFAVTVITVLLSLIPIPGQMILDDRLANTIVAGLLCGAGIGIILRAGACDGGMNVIGMLLVMLRGKGSVGRISLITNVVLYGIMLFLFDIPTVIYSLVYSVFSSIASDRIHTQNIFSQVLVITKLKDTKPMEVEVMGRLHRGMTELSGSGTFTREPVKMFVIYVSKYEAPRLRGIIKSYDPSAFIAETEGVHIDGNFNRNLT